MALMTCCFPVGTTRNPNKRSMKTIDLLRWKSVTLKGLKLFVNVSCTVILWDIFPIYLYRNHIKYRLKYENNSALLLQSVGPVFAFGFYGSVSCLLPFCFHLCFHVLFSFASTGSSHPTWSLSFVMFLMLLFQVFPGVVDITQYNLAQQNSETV